MDSSVYRLPWPTGDGGYELRDVSLHSLKDPEHFSGDDARVLVEPGDGGSALAGSQPKGRFVRTGSGVLIPSDYVTLEAVTAYAHVEKIRDVDAMMGAESSLSWPLSIGVDVQLVSYGQTTSNNAVYDAKLNSLLLVPYDQGGLPLALNAGVLAHEHFHFLFQNLVLSHVHDTATQTSCSGAAPARPTSAPAPDPGPSPSPLPSAKATPARGGNPRGGDVFEKTASTMAARVYNAYVLRGLNEGLADFYGWLYSADDTFLTKSLPDQDFVRRLDSPAGRLPSENLVRRLLVDSFHPDTILPEVVRAHNAYTLGTVYARYLRHLVDDLVSSGRSLSDARLLVGRAVVAMLPELGAAIEPMYETAFLSPNFAIAHILAHLPPLAESVCDSLNAVRAPEASFVTPTACDAYNSAPTPTPSPNPSPSPTPVPKSLPIPVPSPQPKEQK